MLLSLALCFALLLAAHHDGSAAPKNPPREVFGTVVTSDGTPLPAFRIFVSDISRWYPWSESPWQVCTSATTDELGNFRVKIDGSNRLPLVFGVSADERSRVPPQYGRVVSEPPLVMIAEPADAWLKGVVVDEHGAVVPNADVGVFSIHGTYQTKSNEAGEFAFPGLHPTDDAQVQARHGESLSRTIDLEKQKPYAPRELRLKLGPSDWIRGVVVDRDGAPVGGVGVQARHREDASTLGFGSEFVLATTRDDGSFFLGPVPRGDYVVQVDEPALYGSSVNHRSSAADPVSLLATSDAELLVCAVRGKDEVPIEIVRVDRCEEESILRWTRLESVTPGLSRIRVTYSEGQNESPYRLWLFANGFAPQPVDVRPGTLRREPLTVRFDEGHELDVIVLAPDGNPVANARIEFDLDDDLAYPLAVVSTDAEGRARVLHLPPKPLEIEITAEGHPELILAAIDPARRSLEVSLEIGGFIEGVLTRNGVPIVEPWKNFDVSSLGIHASRGAWLRLSDLDKAGRFFLGPLLPGEYGNFHGWHCDLTEFEVWVDGVKVPGDSDGYGAWVSVPPGVTRQVELRVVK